MGRAAGIFLVYFIYFSSFILKRDVQENNKCGLKKCANNIKVALTPVETTLSVNGSVLRTVITPAGAERREVPLAS